MKSLENVKKILFDDFNGIFPRLRDGDYSITQEEKDEIISFANYCNEKLKVGSNLTSDEVIIIMEIVYWLPQYDEEEWTSLFVEEVMLKIEDGIEFDS